MHRFLFLIFLAVALAVGVYAQETSTGAGATAGEATSTTPAASTPATGEATSTTPAASTPATDEATSTTPAASTPATGEAAGTTPAASTPATDEATSTTPAASTDAEAGDTEALATNDTQESEDSSNPEAAGGMSAEDFLQRLSTVRNVLRRRDPFEDTEPEFVKKMRASRGLKPKEEEEDDEPKEEVVINPEDLPPLERFPAEQYEVLAVLVGRKNPRALVRIPGSGGNRVVQKNMAIGDRGGVISDISTEGLVVDEKIRNNFGTFDTEQITIPVGQRK